MLSKVTTIPAKEKIKKKLKVAAYCRVSTEHEEQTRSLKSQIQYYTKLLNGNPEWISAGVYAEQKSGTDLEDRTEFLRMIKDCDDGKIDMITTKSISRFARNTLDTLKMKGGFLFILNKRRSILWTKR